MSLAWTLESLNSAQESSCLVLCAVLFLKCFPYPGGPRGLWICLHGSICCGASAASEQQHNQDLREIYKVGRILEFITFYQNALHLTTLFTRVLCGIFDRREFANEDNGGARGSVLDFQEMYFSALKIKIVHF